ncbi:hypothetical protein TNCV_1337481 [Trichonephila clavipes]|nr:hypothetical protein TNCV_1337481 [Trichonephila clavipes]
MGAQTWCSKRGRRSFIKKSSRQCRGSQISCAALRALAINSREQFIKEQREDPELGHIYRYLQNPDDGSVNATVHQSCLIAGLLRLQVDPEWKLVDVITRPVRPERQREDATNKRRNQSGRIKPIQGDLCPYYLRSRIQRKDRIHEDLNNIEINGIPGSTFRRRSLSMEALNGDPVHGDLTVKIQVVLFLYLRGTNK